MTEDEQPFVGMVKQLLLRKTKAALGVKWAKGLGWKKLA